MENVTQALVDGIQVIASNSMTAIGAVIPAALPIAGAIVVVMLGLTVFKKITR